MSKEGEAGRFTDEQDNPVVVGVEWTLATNLLKSPNGGKVVRREPRQEIGGRGQRPVEDDVSYDGMTGGLGLSLPLSTGVRVTCGQRYFVSSTNIQVGRRGGGSARGERKPYRGGSHRVGSVTVRRNGCSRDW